MKYNPEKKTTFEKQVSLSPLNFKEALATVLRVKLKPIEEEAKEEKKEDRPPN